MSRPLPAPTPEDLAGVDASPLPGTTSNSRTAALREPDMRRLLVVPGLGLRLFALALVAAGLGVPAWLAARDGWGAPGVPGTAGLYQAFTLAGRLLRLGPRRFEFDLDAGTVRARSLFRRTDVPLSGVAAVQVADGGLHKASKGGSYRTYQLNLVLARPGLPRLGLSDNGDREWTHAAGRRLSEFLGVPLLDPARIGEAAGEDATP